MVRGAVHLLHIGSCLSHTLLTPTDRLFALLSLFRRFLYLSLALPLAAFHPPQSVRPTTSLAPASLQLTGAVSACEGDFVWQT